MSDGAKTLRLSKVAKEFNLSLGKIVEFLATKGIKVDSNPNAKIGDEEYSHLIKAFSTDKSAKEEAAQVTQNATKVKRETIILDDVKSKSKKEKDEKEIVFKDMTKTDEAKTKKVKAEPELLKQEKIGRASCRERV